MKNAQSSALTEAEAAAFRLPGRPLELALRTGLTSMLSGELLRRPFWELMEEERMSWSEESSSESISTAEVGVESVAVAVAAEFEWSRGSSETGFVALLTFGGGLPMG